jgi:hypothetical protein
MKSNTSASATSITTTQRAICRDCMGNSCSGVLEPHDAFDEVGHVFAAVGDGV